MSSSVPQPPSPLFRPALLRLLIPLAVVAAAGALRAGEKGVVAFADVARLLNEEQRGSFAGFEIQEQGTSRLLGADFAPLAGTPVGPYVFEAREKGGLAWSHRLVITTEWAIVDRNDREIDGSRPPGEEARVRETVKQAEIRPLSGATCAVPVEETVRRVQAVLAEAKALSLAEEALPWDGGSCVRMRDGETVRQVRLSRADPGRVFEVHADAEGQPVLVLFIESTPRAGDGTRPPGDLWVLERRFYLSDGEVRRVLERGFVVPPGADREKLALAAENHAHVLPPQANARVHAAARALLHATEATLPETARAAFRSQRRLREPPVPLDISAWTSLPLPSQPLVMEGSLETVVLRWARELGWLAAEASGDEIHTDFHPAAPGHAKAVITREPGGAISGKAERFLLEVEKDRGTWSLRQAGRQQRLPGESRWGR